MTRALPVALVLLAGSARADVPTFQADVAPVLAAHCTKCHGGDAPKNGLDLRTRAAAVKGGKTGPAVVPGSLRDSLLWTKVATDNMPAEGPKLSDAQKDTLRRWVVAGAPDTPADVKAAAGPAAAVREKRGVEAVAKAIDAAIDAKLAGAKVPASPPADDAEFVRRAYLDLVGRVPTADQTVAFLDSADPAKRAKLIDELLAHPDHGRHSAVVWHRLMVPETLPVYRNIDHDGLRAWLADGFNRNRPWAEVVSDLVTASGEYRDKGKPGVRDTTSKKPELAFVLAANMDGRPQPRILAANTARLFLGLQVDCAQCHNHPLARWKRSEFWALAAFFERVRYPQAGKGDDQIGVVTEPEKGPRLEYKDKGRHTVVPAVRPEPEVEIEDDGNVGTGRVVRARFLGGAELPAGAKGPYRQTLVQWMTAEDNPYFAKAAVNRVWAQLMGRGLVDPVDDMQEDNPPTHPDVLRVLADEFVATGFDRKHLIRCVCNTNAYGRSSSPVPGNKDAKGLYARQALKQLSAEVLLDSLCVAVPTVAAARNTKDPKKPTSFADEFLTLFETGEVATDYSHGVTQVLRLMNRDGLLFTRAALDKVIDPADTPEANVGRIYLTVLSRRPTADETADVAAYVRANPPSTKPAPKGKAAGDPYADVLWALLNSGEFAFNH